MDWFVFLALLQDGITTGAIYLLLAIGLLDRAQFRNFLEVVRNVAPLPKARQRPPSGGQRDPTFQACGDPHDGHLVATSTSPSPGCRCGSAKESHAHPPHHSARVPMTENPSGPAENGCAITIRPASSRTR